MPPGICKGIFMQKNAHWASPEGIRSRSRQGVGIFAAYDGLLKNEDAAFVSDHNAMGEHASFCAEAFAFLARSCGIPSPARIVDVGCGAGFVSSCLKAHFPQAEVDAFDASESAILFAKRHFSSVNFSVHVVDAYAKLPAAEPYDMIVCNEFYPFSRIDDAKMHAGLVATLLASLPPGGVMFINQAITLPCIDVTLRDVCAELAGKAVFHVFQFPMKKMTDIMGMNRVSLFASRIAAPLLHRLRKRSPILCVEVRHKK